tara:strand:+ start:1070 stop:1984 length:915 start_codon:yes stop_codon:yes gene_type:complete
MGFLSKAWKGIKKHVKKVARGVKKVFKKIGKAVGKLGIVGQLGMMFLMPYAFGALSGFAGQTWNALGQFAKGSTGFLSTPVRAAANMIHQAGTAVGNVYTNISETISGAIDKTKEVLGIKPDEDLIKGVDESLKTGEKVLSADSKEVKDFVSDTASKLKDLSKDAVEEKGKGLLDRFKEIPSKIRADLADFDVYDFGKELATDTVKSGLMGGSKMALKQKTAEALGWEQPEGADFYTIDMEAVNSIGQANPSVYDTVDFLSASQAGNTFFGGAVANKSFVTDILNPQISAYDSFMNNFNRRVGG